MENCPIILDTDPGIDDAVALAVLNYYCPERVRLILTSYGNISVEKTTRNAQTLRALLGWEVPVVKGSVCPENNRYEEAAHIHGADGLGGLRLEEPLELGEAEDGDFLQRVRDMICTLGPVEYITLGPLTNLAALLRRFPEVRPHIARVVCMGGGFGVGNVTKWAEFNIHCDAESADFVFAELPEIALIPLNITNKVAFDLEQIAEMTQPDTPLCRAMGQILRMNYHACVNYGEKGSTMHDSAAVLYALFPELFETERCGVRVDRGEHYGETLREESRRNVILPREAQTPALLERIAEAIRRERPTNGKIF